MAAAEWPGEQILAKIENRTSVMPSTVCLLVSGVGSVVVVGVVGAWSLELGGTRSSKLQGNQTRLQDCGEVRANGKPKKEARLFLLCAERHLGRWPVCCLTCLSACLLVSLPACLPGLVGDRGSLVIIDPGAFSKNSARCSTPSGCPILQPRETEHGGTVAMSIGALIGALPSFGPRLDALPSQQSPPVPHGRDEIDTQHAGREELSS